LPILDDTVPNKIQPALIGAWEWIVSTTGGLFYAKFFEVENRSRNLIGIFFSDQTG
jgi:hypothetical protein